MRSLRSLCRNNAEFVLPYFITQIENWINYILYIDLTVNSSDTILNVYLKKNSRYLKSVLENEPNFSRILFKNGNLCAVFNPPKKYRGIIHSIALIGFNSANKNTLVRMYEQQQKTLTARDEQSGFYCCILCRIYTAFYLKNKDEYQQDF